MHCDRQNFIDCVNGDLMIRRDTSITHLGDSQTAYDAIACAERGEEVVLTVRGKPFSKMVDGCEVSVEETEKSF